MSEVSDVKSLPEETGERKKRRFPAAVIIKAAAILIIVLSLLYMLLVFLTHGDDDSSNPYKVDWIRGITLDGGWCEDAASQGTEEAIRLAAENGGVNLLLRVTADGNGEIVLNYENGCSLAQALDITTGGECSVIIQIDGGGGAAAEALCEFLTLQGYEGNLAVQSADMDALAWLMENRPNVIRGLVTGGDRTGSGGFEGFLAGSMLLNYRCRPHYVVYDAGSLPNISASYIRGQMYVLAAGAEDAERIAELDGSADGFLIDSWAIDMGIGTDNGTDTGEKE